jgi:hypothetical protein
MLLDVLLRCNNYAELPTYREPLYKMLSQILLQDWNISALLKDTVNSNRILDTTDKREILRTVASKMKWHCRDFGMPVIVDYELWAIFEAYFTKNRFKNPSETTKLFVEQLPLFDNHILYYAGHDFNGFYSFAHQGFWDYFYADYFVDLFERKQELNLHQLKTDVCDFWCSKYRHGYISLITAMIDTRFAAEVIDYLISQNGERFEFNNLLLATRCITAIKGWQNLLSEQAKHLRYSLNLRLSEDIYPENVVTQVRAALFELKE